MKNSQKMNNIDLFSVGDHGEYDGDGCVEIFAIQHSLGLKEYYSTEFKRDQMILDSGC